MPVSTTSGREAALDLNPVALRIRANTRSNLPAGTVLAHLGAAIDVVSLGCLASTSILRFGDITAENPGHREAQLRGRRGTWAVWPPYGALSAVREDVLSVRSITYENPIDIAALGSFGKSGGSAIVAFLDAFRLGKPRRKLLTEQAEREQLLRIIEDVTLEVSVEEKFAQLDALKLTNERMRAEVERMRIDNEIRRLELAERIRKAQQDARALGHVIPEWSVEEAAAIADNVRLLGSVELADQADLHTQLEEDYG